MTRCILLTIRDGESVIHNYVTSSVAECRELVALWRWAGWLVWPEIFS